MIKFCGKMMWIVRATVFMVGLAVTLALISGIATAALAAVPGDPFKLGRANTINRLSTLVGAVDNALLRIDNNSGGLSATALDLQVEPGAPPMKVNSDAQVANLNADELDGHTASDFYFYGETVQNSEQLDGLEPSQIGGELFAVVRADGTLARGSSVTRVTSIGTGSYHVIFDRDVTGCAYVATIGVPGTSLILPTGQTSVSTGNSDSVLVLTTGSDGTAVDRPFHLAVLC